MQYMLRNYNKFLMIDSRVSEVPKWEDLYIHRFPSDFRKLVKFDSREEAEAYLKANPQLQATFDAWIVEANPEHWDGKSIFG